MLWHTAGTPREAWTVLAEDASAGDTEIKLQKPVDWQVGDHIAIASTGKRHSQRENEEREIWLDESERKRGKKKVNGKGWKVFVGK